MKKLNIDTSKCTLCGICVAICPYDAISINKIQLTIVHDKCTLCLKCIRKCPTGSFYLE